MLTFFLSFRFIENSVADPKIIPATKSGEVDSSRNRRVAGVSIVCEGLYTVPVYLRS